MGPCQAHPAEAVHLVRDGFPGGADHVREVRVRQRWAEQDAPGSFYPVLTAHLKQDHRQALGRPCVAEFRDPLLDMGQAS